MLQQLQNEILRAVARGASFRMVAEQLCQQAQQLAPDVVCTIVTVDAEARLWTLAAPSVPASYCRAIDGLPIGPDVGSCGTAAFFGRPVTVESIATHPLWSAYKDYALSIGLKACWSSPIKSKAGDVVASFAFYYRTERGPTAFERRIVETCVDLCTIAAEHDEVQRSNHHLAYYDQLTGLPNRRHFLETLERKFKDGRGLGLLLVDIDHLKVANESLGRLAGDALITGIANRLRDAGTGGEVARVGGDEFAILLKVADPQDLAMAATAVKDSMVDPFGFDGVTLHPNVTVGGAVSGAGDIEADAVRQNADCALHLAKETRRGGFVQFSTGMRTRMARRSQILTEAEAALEEGRFCPFYQPIVAIKTRQLVGFEALLRMRRPTGEVVAAAAFQDVFGEAGLSIRLTDLMLRTIAADIRRWIDRGIFDHRVALNLSAADFATQDLEARVCRPLQDAGVSFHHFALEVVESVLIGTAEHPLAQALNRLRSRGMRVALDDFGTGFASLTHLTTLPIDTIKLDRSFVMRVGEHEPSDVVIAAMIDIARKLGLTVIAEGIETEAQSSRLIEMDCHLGQGFLYGRPLDASSAEALLAQDHCQVVQAA